MKRIIFLIFVFNLLSFVVGSMEINNYSVKNYYYSGENLKGNINLSILGEDYDEYIYSNINHSISLGNFLINNEVNFDCLPADCLLGYSYLNPSKEKNINLSSSEKKYLGFFLKGENIELGGLEFNIKSDFEESAIVPLRMKFFEKKNWIFNSFSDTYRNKNWGCYDSFFSSEGPIIGESLYCEMIYLPDSGSFNVGSVVDLKDSANLTMFVYPEEGTDFPWECNYNPNLEEGCNVFPDYDEIFSAGNYQICVGANSLTNYRIYSESSGDNCGFAYGSSVDDSIKDYSIFASSTKYKDSDSYGWENFDFEGIAEKGNEFIQDRYNGNCTSGCVLPIAFSGIPQNIELSNFKLSYMNNGEWAFSDIVYELDVASAQVYFEGNLNLELLNFRIDEEGEFILSFKDEVLFEENFDIVSAPVIVSVLPENPPYGVSTKFYANLNFEENRSFVYKWNFGDNTSSQLSNENFISHVYENPGNYTLFLNVSDGGNFTAEKKFDIITVSPRTAILSNLEIKKNSISSIEQLISTLPSWYGTKILDILDINLFVSDLSRLESLYNKNIDTNLKSIAEQLFSLDSPDFLFTNIVNNPYFITNLEDINIEPIKSISGSVSGATNDLYAEPILIWQNNNIQVNYAEKKFSASYSSGDILDIITVYDLNIVSLSDEKSYFVIDKQFGDLYFKGDVGAKRFGDYTIITLDPMRDKSIEFYYEGGDSANFFVSPSLSSITISKEINEDCNFNLVCEKDKNENWKNCRNDCKPVGLAIFYFIMGFFILLIFYTILQLWYNKKYEYYLFKNSEQLHNLLMYISNARARDMSDLRIESELRNKGWSSERVNYVMKKSRGDRIGMFEIIPLSKIFAYLRDRSARKNKDGKIATSPEQQNQGNINKSRFRVGN